MAEAGAFFVKHGGGPLLNVKGGRSAWRAGPFWLDCRPERTHRAQVLMQAAKSPGSAEGDLSEIVLSRFFRISFVYAGGNCVEIGAGRPDWLSMGALFRSHGWDVLSIEPNPVFADMHRTFGNDVVQCACGAEDRDDADFFIVDSGGADYCGGHVTYESWSSLGIRGDYLASQESHGGTRTTPTKVGIRRLDTILSIARPDWSSIDVIAIDVEGWELEALSGLDFARFRPRVLIVENLFVCASYRRFMRQRGYVLWRRKHPNEIYVRRDMISGPARASAWARSVLPTLAGRARAAVARLWRTLHQPKRTPVNSATNAPV